MNKVVNAVFSDDKIRRESIYCICIAVIGTDSVMRIDKKNYTQVYLQECKYKIKKKKMVEFTDD